LRYSIHVAYLLPIAAVLVAPLHAQNSKPTSPATVIAPSTPTPGNFVDITQSSHVLFNAQASHTSKKYLIETMGSGVALFDYDNDGRSTSSSSTAPPSLTQHPLARFPAKPALNIRTVSIIRGPTAPLKMSPRNQACKAPVMTWV